MENNLKLKVINGHAYADSLEIAVHFKKQHKNVLQAIESRLRDCSEEFSRLNFKPSTYKNPRGKMYPMYNLTRDGFAFVAMSFIGYEAAIWQEAYITAYNEMEAELQRRNVKDGSFEQMNLFPGIQQTIAEDRPTLTVAAVLIVIAYEGLMIPIVTRSQIISMIKRNRLDGFNDGRTWQVYQDSFDTFLRQRRMTVAKAA